MRNYVRAVNLSATTRAIRGEMRPSETLRAANAMRFDALAMHLDAREHVEFHRLSRASAAKTRLAKGPSRIYLKSTNDLVLLT